MSGCAICVQDLYAEALDEYKAAVDSLRSSLALMDVPEDQWPANIRTRGSAPAAVVPKPQNAALSAFEQLERQLLERKKADAQATG